MNAEHTNDPATPQPPSGPAEPMPPSGPAEPMPPGWDGPTPTPTPGPGGVGGVGGVAMPPAGPPPYGPEQGPQQPGPMSWWTTKRKTAAAGVILAISVAAGGTGALGAVALIGDRTVLASPTAVAPASANAAKSNTAQVAAVVGPSVVSITVTTGTGQDTGSGVIIRSDGTIMTNAHVVSAAVQNGGQVSVKFSDGKTATAKVVGTDPSKDIAVVRANGVSGLKPATLGDSGAISVGDPVLAVGSPLGLSGSVTSGIVSALNRTIDESSAQPQQPPNGWPFGLGQRQQQQQPSASIKDAIQTDAAINPGNSGGALVNSSGQVIGINTAIATTSSGSGSIGVGFAIPMNEAKKVTDQILASSGGATGSSSPTGAPSGA